MNALSRLGIKQLRILSALLKEGNLSQVADQMGLTQQAVSANLATLRDVFGDKLFLRTGRGVMPTTLAVELGAEVEAILGALERLVERSPFDPSLVVGTVTVSAADYAMRVALVPRLRDIQRRAPGLKMVLSEIEVGAVATKLGSGEIDLVVSIPDYVPPAYPRRVLFAEEYVCVAAAGSALTGSKVSLEALGREPQVIVSPGRANLIGSADPWFARRGIQRNIVLSVPHFLLVPDILAAIDAVAFLPSRMLPDARLTVLELEDEARPPGFDLIAAWHPRSASSALINWLADQIAK